VPNESTHPVKAAFFGLAFTPALKLKLLGADLLIIESRRPQAMFICFLAGGLGMSITIGIVDVLFVQADAVKTQGSVSASVSRAEASPRAADVESVRQRPRLPPVSVNCCGRRPCMPLCRVGKREQCSQALHSGLAPVANLQQQTAATNARPGGSGACSRLARHARRLTRPAPPLCKQGVSFGRGLIRTMTCRVPNSCPIWRATAVIHGYSGSAFFFASKETA
jgi:hypothetical protein